MPWIETHRLAPGREVSLTKGYVALVDEEDFERVSALKWQANVNGSYVRAIYIRWKFRTYMHHFVLGVNRETLNGMEVDHINGNPLDNRKANLRIVTHAENMANSVSARNRVGVCYNKRAKLWFCYLDGVKPRKNLGYRKTREEALALVQEARNALG